MSEAIGASIGAPAVGAAASAGPAIGSGIGPSMGGEIGMSGIGFDGDSPSFSGLGRSDTGLGSFSVNEGPKGPVSFSNSTDLISETRSFTPSLGSVPEGPVTGNIFSSEMQTLAIRSDIGRSNHSAIEKPSVFGEFAPFQVSMPIKEGPAPLSLGSDFISLTTLSEAPVGPETERELNVEAMVETFVSSEAGETRISTETVPDAIQDMKANDPLTYMQLESDLKLVQNIVDLAAEETDLETSTAISNAAIDVAIERSGLIQSLEQPEDTVDSDAQAEPEAQPVNANVQAIMDAVDLPAEEVINPRQEPQPKARYFVDEDANEARRTDTAQAIRAAFEEDADPVTGEVSGKDVVDRLSPEPPSEEISEIVLKEGGKNDGSDAQRRNSLKLLRLSTIEEGLNTSDRLIEENRAVTDEEATKRATEAEAAKVRSGVKASVGETVIYPLAA